MCIYIYMYIYIYVYIYTYYIRIYIYIYIDYIMILKLILITYDYIGEEFPWLITIAINDDLDKDPSRSLSLLLRFSSHTLFFSHLVDEKRQVFKTVRLSEGGVTKRGAADLRASSYGKSNSCLNLSIYHDLPWFTYQKKRDSFNSKLWWFRAYRNQRSLAKTLRNGQIHDIMSFGGSKNTHQIIT